MQNDQHTYFQAPFFPFSVFHDIHCIASKIPYIWCHSIPFILPKVGVNKKTFPFSLTFLIVWMSQLKTYQFRKLYMSLLRSIWQCCWKEDDAGMSLMTMQSMGDYCQDDDVPMVTEELPTLWRGYNVHQLISLPAPWPASVSAVSSCDSWTTAGEGGELLWWWHYLPSPPFLESLRQLPFGH